MLKRSLCISVAVMLMLTAFSGCAGTEKKAVDSKASTVTGQKKEEPAKSNTQNQIVMKVGHAQPVAHPRHQSYLKFKELVEQKTNNAIKVEIYPSAQLGDEAAMLDAVKMGTLQGVRGGNFESMARELLIYTMPFLFDSLDSIQKVTMGPVGDKIAKNVEKNGLVALATGDGGGFRNITNNKHPITNPDDMKGLKIRTPSIGTIVETMKAFGANPVSIPYGDVYMALKTGVADGEENPFVNIESMKFHEVQKYLTVLEYQFHPDPFIVNLKWYQSLSADQQKILKECAMESMKYNDQLIKESNEKALESIKKSVQVTTLTADQRKAFADKVQPVYDYFIQKGNCTQKDIDEIRAVIKK